MFGRRRAWHEPEPRGWRRAVRGLLIATAGISIPVVIAVWATASFAPRPGEQPPPPTLARADVPEPQRALDGPWLLARERSWVGYRIEEYIPRLNDQFEVAGRTGEVAGLLVLDETGVEGGWVEADLRHLESDNERRDRAIQRRFLEARDFPDARFEIPDPVPLLGTPAPGEPTTVPVTGELTLREVTLPVRPLLRVRWDGDALRVVGTVPIALDDYGIRPPVLPGFRVVEDHATIELDLTFVPEP